MVPLPVLESLVFFIVASMLLSLPWRGVVALFERLPARPGLGASRYVLLLVTPVALAVAFVLATLGPWDSPICQTLHHACLDRIAAWQVPAQLGLGLGAIALIAFGRLIRPFQRHGRVRPMSVPMPDDLTAKWEGVCRAVQACTGSAVLPVSVVASPAHLCQVRGLVRPRLVVSETVLRELDPEELAGAIGHEMAHVARGDVPVGFLAFLSFCLLFFTPVGHRCYQRYLEERECAADDWTIERTRAPLALAAALAKVGKLVDGTRGPAAVTLSAGGPLLERRLQRLLQVTPEAPGGPSLVNALQLVLIALIGTLGSAWLLSLHHAFEEAGLSLLRALGVVA